MLCSLFNDESKTDIVYLYHRRQQTNRRPNQHETSRTTRYSSTHQFRSSIFVTAWRCNHQSVHSKCWPKSPPKSHPHRSLTVVLCFVRCWSLEHTLRKQRSATSVIGNIPDTHVHRRATTSTNGKIPSKGASKMHEFLEIKPLTVPTRTTVGQSTRDAPLRLLPSTLTRQPTRQTQNQLLQLDRHPASLCRDKSASSASSRPHRPMLLCYMTGTLVSQPR